MAPGAQCPQPIDPTLATPLDDRDHMVGLPESPGLPSSVVPTLLAHPPVPRVDDLPRIPGVAPDRVLVHASVTPSDDPAIAPERRQTPAAERPTRRRDLGRAVPAKRPPIRALRKRRRVAPPHAHEGPTSTHRRPIASGCCGNRSMISGRAAGVQSPSASYCCPASAEL